MTPSAPEADPAPGVDPAPGADRLSVAVITRNEERDLPDCLASLPVGAEVVIVDSESTDRTLEIARAAGAKILTRPFTDYGDQKNAAVGLATRPWVLSVDADERLSPRLRDAVAAVAADPADPCAGYRVRRRLVFMGRRMRFGKTADRPLRLFRRERGRFVGPIHERVEVDGPVGRLPGELLHHSYHDLDDYFRRFNDYTRRVAETRAAAGRRASPLHVLRPWVGFGHRYLLRLGFLDGYPGWVWAQLGGFYEFVKAAKLRELERR